MPWNAVDGVLLRVSDSDSKSNSETDSDSETDADSETEAECGTNLETDFQTEEVKLVVFEQWQ